MAGIFDSGIFDSGIFKVASNGIFSHPPFDTGIFDHASTVGTFDTGIFDRNIFDNILGPVTAGTTGSGPGFALTFGDRDWERQRKARQALRREVEDAFRLVTDGPPKQRRRALAEAKDAMAQAMGELAADPLLPQLRVLMAQLEGLVAQEQAIRIAQARQAAEAWAQIEAAIRREQELVEELAIILALAI